MVNASNENMTYVITSLPAYASMAIEVFASDETGAVGASATTEAQTLETCKCGG